MKHDMASPDIFLSVGGLGQASGVKYNAYCSFSHIIRKAYKMH